MMFIVQASLTMTNIYNHNMFIVQATDGNVTKLFSSSLVEGLNEKLCKIKYFIASFKLSLILKNCLQDTKNITTN
jgi:hypothetical protein